MNDYRDVSSRIGFGFNPVNRQAELRDGQAFGEVPRADPQAGFLVLCGETPVLRRRGGGLDALFDAAEVAALGQAVTEIYVGRHPAERPLFAVDLGRDMLERLTADASLAPVDLRTIAAQALLPEEIVGALAGAKSLLDWHARHGFCARCGHRSDIRAAGWRRDCPNCGAQHFPRVDPVVIMIAIDEERCLLGRQKHFAPGMYSALAGFLEPGETIEAAVRRELGEEAGVACSEVVYHASQPWPFPSSLMIGCFARAISPELTVDYNEMEDVRWFSRQEAAAMLAGSHAAGLLAPQPVAIAHHLVRAFVDRGAAVLSPPNGAGPA